MFIAELFQLVFTAQSGSGGSSGVAVAFDCASRGISCPGSAFSSLAAAFTTEGYFVQSDIIHYLLTGDIGLWAPLLYILAAAGGMLGVALGMPPKNYMWFFIGPAFYHFLLATPQAVHGVEWRVGNIPQDQREVWKLAEVGLLNTRIIRRLNYQVYSDQPPRGGPYGDGSVPVAYVFAWYDALVSDTVQWLIQWTGVYNEAENYSTSEGKTNVSSRPRVNSSGARLVRDPSTMTGGAEWHLLSGLKWQFVESITSSMVHTADLRDAFISFMSSECGDKLAEYTNFDAVIAAQSSKNGNVPNSIFSDRLLDGARYETIRQGLSRTSVPAISSLQNLLRSSYWRTPNGNANSTTTLEDRSGMFSNFINQDNLKRYKTTVFYTGMTTCSDYFEIIMNGFRWEAGHAFYQMVTSKSPALVPENFVYTLFYGWDIKSCGSAGAAGCTEKTAPLSTDQQMRYLQDMILVYMMRNELKLAPKVLGNPRSTGAVKVEDYAKTHLRTVGQKSKFAEIFTAVNMLPYIQGTLLYFLAMAYPFACIMVVIPGWHKTIFTWMSFWAWVKLWDVGLALVQVVERSIWAMMGNGSAAKKIADKIVDLGMLNTNIDFSCPSGSEAISGYLSSGAKFSCVVPTVCDGVCSGGVSAASNGMGPGVGASFPMLLGLFDRSVALAGSLDLDLSNSLYLMIMAALYIAIPAVTGQLVLGAKSGASGLVSTMIGGPSAEAGRAAGAAFSSDMTQKAKASSAALGQTAYFKGMRSSGVTNAALDAGNKSSYWNMIGTLANGAREAYGQREALIAAGYNKQQASFGTAQANMGLIRGIGENTAGAVAYGVSRLIPGSGGNGAGGEAAAGLRAVAGKAVSGVFDRQAAMMNRDQQDAAGKYAHDLGDLNVARSQISMGAMEGAGRAAGYGLAQSRLGAEAHFQGENAAWSAKNDYATAVSGELSAMGVSAGVLDPGPKPQHFEGAAMTGMLGQDMTAKAHYSDGEQSQFFSQFYDARDSIDGIKPSTMMELADKIGGIESNNGLDYEKLSDPKIIDDALKTWNDSDMLATLKSGVEDYMKTGNTHALADPAKNAFNTLVMFAGGADGGKAPVHGQGLDLDRNAADSFYPAINNSNSGNPNPRGEKTVYASEDAPLIPPEKMRSR